MQSYTFLDLSLLEKFCKIKVLGLKNWVFLGRIKLSLVVFMWQTNENSVLHLFRMGVTASRLNILPFLMTYGYEDFLKETYDFNFELSN